MTTNFLNLDTLRTERTVMLNGKERKLRSMTVKQFIERFDLEEKFKNANQAQQFEMLVGEIPKFMSDTTRAELEDLELIQLNALFNFIRGTDEDTEKAKAAVASAEGKEVTAKQ